MDRPHLKFMRDCFLLSPKSPPHVLSNNWITNTVSL